MEFIVMNKKIYLLTSLFSFLSISLADAQTYNEYGLRRPMSDRELGIYNQCQGTVRTWMWPEPVNGMQMTFHEALGPDIVMRLCACTAIRSTGHNMFEAVWQSCVDSVIRGTRQRR